MAARAHKGKQERVQRFLARQPIFHSARVVYRFALLFRSGPENRYDALRALPPTRAVRLAMNLSLN
jgi:c-di-GMP-related signal transduction protein